MQCSSQVFECRGFPTAAIKSQSQKLKLLPPIPQTLFLLQSRSAPKSLSVYGSPILLVMERRNPSQHAPKQLPREVILRQQQPVISGVIRRPPVFTSRCCNLVSDQWSILLGSTSRRHAT